MMNWKEYGRKRSWPDSRYYPGICPQGQGRPRKLSVRVTGFRTQIWTHYLRNTKHSQDLRYFGLGKSKEYLLKYRSEALCHKVKQWVYVTCKVFTAVRITTFFWVLAPYRFVSRSVFKPDVSPEDGHTMFLRNFGVYRQIYTAPEPRRTLPAGKCFVCSHCSGSLFTVFVLPSKERTPVLCGSWWRLVTVKEQV